MGHPLQHFFSQFNSMDGKKCTELKDSVFHARTQPVLHFRVLDPFSSRHSEAQNLQLSHKKNSSSQKALCQIASFS